MLAKNRVIYQKLLKKRIKFRFKKGYDIITWYYIEGDIKNVINEMEIIDFS